MSNEQMRPGFEVLATHQEMDLNRYEAGYSDCNTDYGWLFWQAATLAERERCALVCEKVDSEQMGKVKQTGQNHYEDYAIGAELCTAAIRLPPTATPQGTGGNV